MALNVLGRPVRLSFRWLKPPPGSPDGSMSLFEHLAELRYRLVVAGVAIIVGTIVSYFFKDQLYALMSRPYFIAVADLKAKNPEAVTTLVNTGLTAPFTLVLKISAVGGLLLTAPIWLWQVWSFIVPGLLAKEKKWALIFIGAATPLFFAGVAVGYIVIPKGLTALLGFTQTGVTNMQDVTSFLNFMLRVMVVFGIAFLIPLLVLMLNILGVIKAKHLAKYRVYVVFFTFVFGAVATPSTDPFSMLALALPMAVLFLAAEVIAHILDHRKAKRLAAGGGEVALRDSVSEDRSLKELSADEDGSVPEQR